MRRGASEASVHSMLVCKSGGGMRRGGGRQEMAGGEMWDGKGEVVRVRI